MVAIKLVAPVVLLVVAAMTCILLVVLVVVAVLVKILIEIALVTAEADSFVVLYYIMSLVYSIICLSRAHQHPLREMLRSVVGFHGRKELTV